MIENVVEVELAVDEKLIISKNRLKPLNMYGNEKRLTIVTGTHGDELEGQFVCSELIKRINENMDRLKGIVDVYPAINPLGLDSITRGIPMFELDMNRIFPGDDNGPMVETVASKIVDDIVGSDLCVDIHSSNIFLREVPQVRMTVDTKDKLMPYAKMLNTDFIWIHQSPNVTQSTLAHSLNSMGIPTLVVEMGVGMRITKDYCMKLVDGIFNMMIHMGIWEDNEKEVSNPIVSTDGEVEYINAQSSGIFVPEIKHGTKVSCGEVIGVIKDVLNGCDRQIIKAPCSGIVFTLREYPVVYNGSLIARILGGSF